MKLKKSLVIVCHTYLQGSLVRAGPDGERDSHATVCRGAEKCEQAR